MSLPPTPIDSNRLLAIRLRKRRRAFAAFRAAIEEAPGRLELLHQALEKDHGAVVIRGSWQHERSKSERPDPRYAACPLSLLFADKNRDVEATVRASEEALGRHGFKSADFYEAWDMGLIQTRELLRIVDRTLTAALLGERSF